jgi:hypothetical protein
VKKSTLQGFSIFSVIIGFTLLVYALGMIAWAAGWFGSPLQKYIGLYVLATILGAVLLILGPIGLVLAKRKTNS